jgi:hypothetical protein
MNQFEECCARMIADANADMTIEQARDVIRNADGATERAFEDHMRRVEQRRLGSRIRRFISRLVW